MPLAPFTQGKQQEVTELGPVAEALRQRLAAKRGVDASQRADPLKRSLAEIVAQFGVCRPRIERALRDMQELGAVRLVPWRKGGWRTGGTCCNDDHYPNLRCWALYTAIRRAAIVPKLLA